MKRGVFLLFLFIAPLSVAAAESSGQPATLPAQMPPQQISSTQQAVPSGSAVAGDSALSAISTGVSALSYIMTALVGVLTISVPAMLGYFGWLNAKLSKISRKELETAVEEIAKDRVNKHLAEQMGKLHHQLRGELTESLANFRKLDELMQHCRLDLKGVGNEGKVHLGLYKVASGVPASVFNGLGMLDETLGAFDPTRKPHSIFRLLQSLSETGLLAFPGDAETFFIADKICKKHFGKGLSPSSSTSPTGG